MKETSDPTQQQREEFLLRAHEVIVDAIGASELGNAENSAQNLTLRPGQVRSPSAARVGRARISKARCFSWLLEEALEDQGNWERTVRFVTAVCDGIETGTISLNSLEDVSEFGQLFSSGFYRIPQVVEHYAKIPDELLEVVTLARSNARNAFNKETMWALHRDNVHIFLAARLYRFDMSQQQVLRGQGGDEESILSVPLEIRAEFAGISAESTNEEFEWYHQLLDSSSAVS